jgi:hypothetical protein
MTELETQLLKALTGLSAEFDQRSSDLEKQVQDLNGRLDKNHRTMTSLIASLSVLEKRLTEVSSR